MKYMYIKHMNIFIFKEMKSLVEIINIQWISNLDTGSVFFLERGGPTTGLITAKKSNRFI